jgi:multiple sugar transport system substrate-binding protein
MTGGKSATCIGGWQWAVSAFSRHKAAAARLVQFMGTREASRFLAAQGALLPVYPEVYAEAEVVKAVPWFKDAAAVVNFGRSRPMSERYGEVSDTIRTVTSAVLARTTPAEEGVAQIEGRLRRVMR